MKKIRIVALAMLTVLLAACHEELDLIEKVQEGLPARLDLTISLPSSEKIQTKGIHDYESEISELMLIMYEANDRKMVVDLTGKISAGAADGAYGGHRTYTTTEEIATDYYGAEILSGTYRVYAIANWSSPFCQLSQNAILEMSEDELNKAVGTNSGFVHQLTGDQKFPMTGYTENIVINPCDPNGATTVTGISLRRMIAHIEFSFVSGTGIKFVPQTYQIFNIPSGAYLMDNRTKTDSGWSNTEENKYEGAYGHSSSIDIVSGGEIAFFMQENVQGPAESVTSYAERDKWSGTRVDGTKSFLNAPENATYVVVTGEYEDGKYTGTLSYTIHLGKFGKSSEASGANNFEVSRNEYHTYTITINGRDSIIAEAESEDQENGGIVPGAEGTLTLTNKGSQFVLDAHYETVMLSFSLSDLCAQPTMIIQTPYSGGLKEYSLTDAAALSGVDYKWIHFMKPASTSALSPYPTTAEQNAGALTDVVGLANELKSALEAKNSGGTPSGDHILIDNSTVYVQAFVDEYFYETDPAGSKAKWTDFVNNENRTLILNPEKNVSPDGNSIVYPDYIFQISQRSIKTTYGTASSTVNGFGIETWNETGRVEWGVTLDNDSGLGLDDYNGYANTATLLGISWLSDDVLSTAGYLTSITSNTKEAHVFYSSGTGMSGVYGYNSCLTRNRDENGDGTIDGTELKWYLPAVFQYTNLWMGLDYLKEDTQLFDPETEISSSNDLLNYNLYTSSSTSKAQAEYWAIEGASYGGREHTNAVRCVRNLYDTDSDGIYDDDNALITYNDSKNSVISVLSASESALRTTNMTGEYTAGHNERDVNNRLPSAFEVAEKNLLIGTDASTNVTLSLYDLGEVPFGITDATATYSNYYLNANLTFATTEYTYSLKGESPITGSNLAFNLNLAQPWVTLVISDGNADDYIALYFNFGTDGSFNSITIYKLLDNEDYVYNSSNNWGMTDSPTSLATLTFSSENRNTFTKSEIHDNATGFCATYYSQEEDGSDLGQWRIPNQRELMLMAEYGYLSDASSSNAYASRTFFSYYDYKTEPFSYNGHVTLQSDSGDSFVIRCVRDATPTNPTTLEDATYSNSNNSLY